MSLPKLETPTFKLKVPSTGKSITYRPFLVKEEKLMLMLNQDRNASGEEIADIIKNVITTCVLSEINVDELTMFDMEYIFICLRAKSVGEEIDLMLKCSECGNGTAGSINLDKDVFIENLNNKLDKKDFTLKLSDDVGLILRYPKIEDIAQDIDEKENSYRLLRSCIESVYDSKTVYNLSEYTEKEVKEFLSNMSVRDTEKIAGFLNKMPKVKCKAAFTCGHCSKENTLEIEGLSSFF